MSRNQLGSLCWVSVRFVLQESSREPWAEDLIHMNIVLVVKFSEALWSDTINYTTAQWRRRPPLSWRTYNGSEGCLRRMWERGWGPSAWWVFQASRSRALEINEGKGSPASLPLLSDWQHMSDRDGRLHLSTNPLWIRPFERTHTHVYITHHWPAGAHFNEIVEQSFWLIMIVM